MFVCKRVLVTALLCLSAGLNILATDNPYPPISERAPGPGQREHLRRSLTLLAESTPEQRHTVRVLFYGQSITQQAWWKTVADYLRSTYTNANLIIENRAIGGHSSQLLVKTAESDLYPFQPDLVIFHVYGSHIEYENIIRGIRERTCADILLQTDHITRDEALTEETDPAKLTPAKWDAWMNHSFLPATAAKYGACRADIHEMWKGYLREHKLKASELLKDSVHLNQHGEWLMAELLKQYVAPLAPKAGYNPMQESRVQTHLWPPSTSADGAVLTVQGTRLDIVWQQNTSKPLAVQVDDMKPSSFPEHFKASRVSAFPGSDWPILLKTSHEKPLIAETWSVAISQVHSNGAVCRFEVRGSVTGQDGGGWSTNRFVSKSGRVVIEPTDWNLAFCVNVFKRTLPEGHIATWKAEPTGVDVADPAAVKSGPGLERTITIATFLPAGKHKLRLPPEASSQGLTIRAYIPPLRQTQPDASTK